MSNAFIKPGKTPHCSRCGRTYNVTDSDADQWNADFDAGALIGHVCPRCQTGLDSMGAEIDSIEIEGGTILNTREDFLALSDENKGEVITQIIEQRVRRVIEQKRIATEVNAARTRHPPWWETWHSKQPADGPSPLVTRPSGELRDHPRRGYGWVGSVVKRSAHHACRPD